MLFCSQTVVGPTNASPQAEIRTVDCGKIVLGGGFRLPACTVDKGTIRLGGGFRLPVRRA